MPITPPYGLIDTIARLREQRGQAIAQAISSLGQNIGAGLNQHAQRVAEQEKNSVPYGVARTVLPGLPVRRVMGAAEGSPDEVGGAMQERLLPPSGIGNSMNARIPISMVSDALKVDAENKKTAAADALEKQKLNLPVTPTMRKLAMDMGNPIPKDQSTMNRDEWDRQIQLHIAKLGNETKRDVAAGKGGKPSKDEVQRLRARLTELKDKEKALGWVSTEFPFLHPVDHYTAKKKIQLERDQIDAQLAGGGTAEGPADPMAARNDLLKKYSGSSEE